MRDVFSKQLLGAALADPRILLLTGDHGHALFDEFREKIPNQFINVGVAEQNMVGVAAGLSKAGFRPIVYGLSAFIPIRVLEQIKLDVCYEKSAVTFIGDGAGVVHSYLGSSHQSTEDIAVLRAIPHIQILSPCDVHEMGYAMRQALRFEGPLYLRMGKGDVGTVHDHSISEPLGDLISVKSGDDTSITFLATGSMVKTAIELSRLAGDFPVWSVPTIRPINKIQVVTISKASKCIVVLEEHSTIGGLGSLISEIVSEVGDTASRVVRLGIEDRFSEKCGSYRYLMEEHGLSPKQLLKRIAL